MRYKLRILNSAEHTKFEEKVREYMNNEAPDDIKLAKTTWLVVGREVLCVIEMWNGEE
jgi:hypothetical protein